MNEPAKEFEIMDTHALPQAKPPSEYSASKSSWDSTVVQKHF